MSILRANRGPTMAPILDMLDRLPASLPATAVFMTLGLAVAISIQIYLSKSVQRSLKRFPQLTLPGLTPKESWETHARALMKEAEWTLKEQPFQVMAGTGPKLIVPNKFCDELEDHPSLDRTAAVSKDWFFQYPGFEAFRSTISPTLIKNCVQQTITPSLVRVTENLVDEATAAIHDLYGESPDWQSVMIKEQNFRLIARMSSRVFLGKPLCRNEEWVDISRTYTSNAVQAMRAMSEQIPIMRWFAHWYSTPNQTMVQQVKAARRLLNEEVDKRVERTKKAQEAGEKSLKISNAAGWEETDDVNVQLALATVAINTTVEAITSCMLDLCENPELIPMLRKEVIDVLSTESWTRRAADKMKLMDAFLEESQRVHPPAVVSMLREVKKDITLSDGTVLPRGIRLMVANRFFNSDLHGEPHRFDINRFQNSQTHAYVTTTPEFMEVGYGDKATCPGRFLVNNELKIVLCHLLLKYDMELDDRPSLWTEYEETMVVDPFARIRMKRRVEEVKVDLDYVVE